LFVGTLVSIQWCPLHQTNGLHLRRAVDICCCCIYCTGPLDVLFADVCAHAPKPFDLFLRLPRRYRGGFGACGSVLARCGRKWGSRCLQDGGKTSRDLYGIASNYRCRDHMHRGFDACSRYSELFTLLQRAHDLHHVVWDVELGLVALHVPGTGILQHTQPCELHWSMPRDAVPGMVSLCFRGGADGRLQLVGGLGASWEILAEGVESIFGC
jgi:hypothetical protein